MGGRAGLKLILPDGYLMTVLDLEQPATTVCDETYPDLQTTWFRETMAKSTTPPVVTPFASRIRRHGSHARGPPTGASRIRRRRRRRGPILVSRRAGLRRRALYLFVADASNGLIRRVDVETGETIRVAGCVPHTEGLECPEGLIVRDGPGDHAYFDGPQNIAIDNWGDLYVAEARPTSFAWSAFLPTPTARPACTASTRP